MSIFGDILGPILGAQATKSAAGTSAKAQKEIAKISVASTEKISEEGFLMSAAQSQTGTLVNLLASKQKEQPVYTLGPTAQPMTWLDQLNWTIHSFLIKLFGQSNG